jgi:hypothetical protein
MATSLLVAIAPGILSNRQPLKNECLGEWSQITRSPGFIRDLALHKILQ